MKEKIQRGFTLVEILAVITVFITVGVVTTGIFLGSFRATNKSNTLALLRQNGSYAVTQFEKMLRFATLNGLSTDIGIPATFSACSNSPGGVLTQYSHVQITNLDGGVTTFSCTTGQNGNIASASATESLDLLDSSIVTAVDACYFTCARTSSYSPPIVTLHLTVAQRNSLRVEDTTVIPLQSSVSMRNSSQGTK